MDFPYPTAFAAGYSHTVALTDSGRLVAFGANDYGQCNVPSLLKGEAFTLVAAGEHHTVALTTAGRFLAMGRQRLGTCAAPPVGAGEAYLSVALGDYHTAVLTTSGRLLVFGYNGFGQCDVPALPAGEAYKMVAVGEYHTVAITTRGRLVAFGANGVGQCHVPHLGADDAFRAVGAGNCHTVALTARGRLLAFGGNLYGQCEVPRLIPGDAFQAVSAGCFHTLALTTSGLLLAFGLSHNGQCDVPALAANEAFAAVIAGEAHNIALTTTGRLVAFGRSDSGQCKVPALATGEHFTDHSDHVRYVPGERDASLQLGVSASYLLRDFVGIARAWADRNRAQIQEQHCSFKVDDPSFLQIACLTTSDPRDRLWCPRDGKLGCSYVDSLAPPDNGRATHFLSWVWQYRLSTVVSALQPWVEKYEDTEKDQAFFWICWFCNNQFRLQGADEDLDDIFRKRLTDIGSTIALLDTWQQSLYFTRSWCIYEQYVAFDLRAPVTVIMPEAEVEALLKVINRGSAGVAKIKEALQTIDCHKATASRCEDREAVMAAITAGPGAQKVNRIVQTRMAKSIQEACKTGIRQLQVLGRIADLEASVEVFKEGYAASQAEVADLKRGLARSEAKVAELQGGLVRSEARVKELDDARTRSEARVTELEDALARSEALASDLQDAFARSDARVSNLEDAILELRQAVKIPVQN